jgi:hypothetical protein
MIIDDTIKTNTVQLLTLRMQCVVRD